MHKLFVFVLVLTSLGFAQAQLPSAPAQAPNAPTKPDGGAELAPVETPAEVPPSAPVITLHGLCSDKPAGTDPKSPECETVITRAEFEKLADALSPNMAVPAKQKLASDYARMLVIASRARTQGLENTEHYKELLGFLKKQLLAQELFRNLQEKAKPSEAEVEKSYNDNAAKYDEISVNRLFIPRNRPEELMKKTDANTPSKPPTDAELQAEGDKFRARLEAGESFDKLEKEVYEKAGFKTPPPPTTMPNLRRGSLPPSEEKLFNLKPKEISQVMVEPAGAYIYEVTSKTRVPLANVKQEIESTLTNERLRADMEALMADVKPEANQAYFRALAAEQKQKAPTPAVEPETSTPHSAAPNSAKSAAAKPAAKKPASAAATPK